MLCWGYLGRIAEAGAGMGQGCPMVYHTKTTLAVSLVQVHVRVLWVGWLKLVLV